MRMLNIAGYKFISLNNIEDLRLTLFTLCDKLMLKGTILVSPEGINISLAGSETHIDAFKTELFKDERFHDMNFHHTYSDVVPFKRLKVKLRKEIISFRRADVDPVALRAPSVTPEEFKRWVDEKRDITILDTRNDYEVRFGTFTDAVNLHIDDFCELPKAVETIDKQKPIVMFCTGGIRCEKAAIYMQNQGYANVYQLDGGILGYFAKVGGDHYDGECFVFDERVAVNANLAPAGTLQCQHCNGPVSVAQQKLASFVPGKSCAHCL